eukprot:6822388-Pyramimonas_sp.AAC.1
MHALRAQLDAEEPALRLPADERNSVQRIVRDADTTTTVPLLDVTFADEGTISVIVPASDLYPAMYRAFTVVTAVFASRGHLLNLGDATKAAILVYRGKRSKKAKQHAWHECGGH